MVVALPGHLATVLAAVNLDVVEVRRQLMKAAASATGDDQDSLLETAAQLLAVESSVACVLAAQGELQSRPEGEKP